MSPLIRRAMLLCVLFVLGLVPDASAQKKECVPKCRSGYVCEQGQCVGACDPPCAPNQVCTPQHACVSACNPACAPNQVCSPSGDCVSACNPPCASGEACTPQGQCVEGCSPACGPGEVCSPAGRCVSACNPACPAGQVCSPQGECVSACNPACPVGQVCSPQGECVSACNPACAPNQSCSPAGECVSKCNPPCGSGEICTPQLTCEKGGETPPESDTFHAILGAGAVYLPLNDAVTAVALTGGVGLSGTKWDRHILLSGYHVEDSYTKTTGAMLHTQAIYWPGAVYGLGFGAGLSYADFTRERTGGWDDSSFAVAAYVMPAVFRLGRHPQFQIAATAGAINFTTHEVGPWGYLGVLTAL